MNIQGKAKVQIMVEVDVGLWGDNCSLKQFHAQAAESAIDILRAHMKPSLQCRLVGDARVVGIITEELK